MPRPLFLFFFIILHSAAVGDLFPLEYRGMDSVMLRNSSLEVIVTPGINRIMSLRRLPNGENMLWNSWLHRHYPWINYGGSKLLPAPQSAWKYVWPPDKSADQLPGKIEIIDDNAIILKTPYCREYGISFERRLTLHPSLPLLCVEETIVNRSNIPRSWSVWEISQLRPGGTAIIPYFDPAHIDDIPQLADFGFRFQNDMLLIRDCQKKVKGFYHSPLGIMGYRLKDTTLWRFSPPAIHDATYPEDERSLTFFSGMGTFELETVSPMWRLQPGERRTTTHYWFVARGNDAPLPFSFSGYHSDRLMDWFHTP